MMVMVMVMVMVNVMVVVMVMVMVMVLMNSSVYVKYILLFSIHNYEDTNDDDEDDVRYYYYKIVSYVMLSIYKRNSYLYSIQGYSESIGVD